MNNIYYSPEKFGLTVIKDVDWRHESYEFTMTALWRDAEGNFYAGSDSGCSCPSPFEDITDVASLDLIKCHADLLAHIKQASEQHIFDWDATESERADLLSAYQNARTAS